MRDDAIEAMRPVRRKGGIVIWEGPRPVDDDEPTAEEATDMLLGILERIDAATTPRLVRWICDDCGCALRTATELCPACAISWCRWQEIRHSWAHPTTYYKKEAA